MHTRTHCSLRRPPEQGCPEFLVNGLPGRQHASARLVKWSCSGQSRSWGRKHNIFPGQRLSPNWRSAATTSDNPAPHRTIKKKTTQPTQSSFSPAQTDFSSPRPRSGQTNWRPQTSISANHSPQFRGPNVWADVEGADVKLSGLSEAQFRRLLSLMDPDNGQSEPSSGKTFDTGKFIHRLGNRFRHMTGRVDQLIDVVPVSGGPLIHVPHGVTRPSHHHPFGFIIDF
ncbi:hypothetical protein CRG98_002532 [Punica granatum]|uniref:Uncharacterized protein n=1 Tax=Punica granatum TaxID=22663 RepID=A0A2I0L8J8_PUNGR|nr:hypothetical protein CRG98_002532 [Punica granatum]